MTYLEDRLKNDTESWAKVLQTYLGKVAYRKPPEVRVLDAACGYFFEARALGKYFGDGARIVGVDVNPLVVSEARDLIQTHYPELAGRVDILEDDVKLHKTQTDESIDVAITRNPQISHGHMTWSTGYKQLKRVLRKDGILLATFKHQGETHFGKKFIQDAGFDILISEENPYFLVYEEEGDVDMRGNPDKVLAQWSELTDYDIVVARK